jgi:hypothetical protein
VDLQERAPPSAGALSRGNPIADHRRWRGQQRLAGAAVETRVAENSASTSWSPAAQHEQVEQDRAPPLFLYQPSARTGAKPLVSYRVIVELISATTTKRRTREDESGYISRCKDGITVPERQLSVALAAMAHPRTLTASKSPPVRNGPTGSYNVAQTGTAFQTRRQVRAASVWSDRRGVDSRTAFDEFDRVRACPTETRAREDEGLVPPGHAPVQAGSRSKTSR